MNEQQIKTTLADLNSIKEKLFAGKAATEENELAKLFSQIEGGLTSVISNKPLLKEDNLLSSWTEILKAIAAGDFAGDHCRTQPLLGGVVGRLHVWLVQAGQYFRRTFIEPILKSAIAWLSDLRVEHFEALMGDQLSPAEFAARL